MNQEAQKIVVALEPLLACYKFASYNPKFCTRRKRGKPKLDRYVAVVPLEDGRVVYQGSEYDSVMFWFTRKPVGQAEMAAQSVMLDFSEDRYLKTDAYMAALSKSKHTVVDIGRQALPADSSAAGFLDMLRQFRAEDYMLENLNMTHDFPAQVRHALGWNLDDLCMYPFRRKDDKWHRIYWFSPRIYLNEYPKKSISTFTRSSGNPPADAFDVCFISMPFGLAGDDEVAAVHEEIANRVSDFM
jgi:hypothetical protein